MKLNKLQRHFLYIILLEEAKLLKRKDFHWAGVCTLVELITGRMPTENIDFCFANYPILYKNIIPEFYDNAYIFGGSQYKAFWWACNKEGWNKRIELLKYCIKLTENG